MFDGSGFQQFQPLIFISDVSCKNSSDSKVFLFRREELEFFCGPSGGASSLAPAAWRSFSSWLPSGITSAEAVAAAFRRAALGKDEWLGMEVLEVHAS